MYPILRVLALLLLGLARIAKGGGPKEHRSCSRCVAAGFGWSLAKQKCGGFKNTACPLVAPSSEPEQACKAGANAATGECVEEQVKGEAGWYGNIKVAGQVERKVWDRSNPRFAEDVMAAGTPAIFTGTPADKVHTRCATAFGFARAVPLAALPARWC